ncbi:MAG: hypothetical protein M3N68_04370 [Actinomycetota bacterium]|nr:hypothetical protein [Actinomycetota bacterium]
MHPIERLRSVARAEGVSPSALVREAAGALAGFGHDPVGLVTACRRLVDRHPAVGPVWWLAARVLTAGETAEAWRAVEDVAADETSVRLGANLPQDGRLVVLGWPEQVVEAVRRRGDLEVLVVDCGGEASGVAHLLRGVGVDAVDVPDTGLGAAVASADLVALEAWALGPGGVVAVSGSRAAAAVAHHAGIPVWAVAGVGRALPAPLWDAMAARLHRSAEGTWDRLEEVVPAGLLEEVAGPAGCQPAAEAVRRADCPVAPELLKVVA